MVTRLVTTVLLIQVGCLLNAELIPSKSNFKAFHLWMENHYEPRVNEREYRSPECQGKPDGIYGNPTDCSPDYVVCRGGNTVGSASCPTGEIFDDNMGSCVLPESSTNCKNPVVVIPPFTCTDGREDGFYPISECSPNYYSCLGGEMFLEKCPAPGFVFDPVLLACKSNSSVPGCSTDSSSTTANPMTTSKPIIPPTQNCSDGRPDGLYPISECSANYYSCSGGNIQFEKCQYDGYVFDPELLVCKYNATVPGCLSLYNPIMIEKFVCPEPNGSFPTPTGCCNLYYNCISSEAFLMKCPGATTDIFDPKKFTCTSVDNASCYPSSCQNYLDAF